MPGLDRRFGAGWIVLGAAVLVAAWRMDRLEAQHINPWSAPGLLPGLLGALMIVFGAALCVRRSTPGDGAAAQAAPGRILLAMALCVGFAAGLVGQGLPFWCAAALFLFVAISAFRWLDGGAAVRPARLLLESAAIAICASAAISLLFQEVFLVRLP
jgi:hypothetical protein